MAAMIDPLTLAMLMRGVNPDTIRQGLYDQQDASLQGTMGQAQSAQTAADAAQANVRAAETAPAPQVSGFLDSLFGNTAAVLGGNPAYAAQAEARTVARQGDAMEARKQNLEGLAKIYEQKAGAAEKLGNFAVAEKARISHERVTKTLADMDEQRKMDEAHRAESAKFKQESSESALDRQNRLDLEAMRQRGDLATAGAKAQRDSADYLDQFRGTTRLGNEWLDSTNVPKNKDAQVAALRYAKENRMKYVDPASAKNLHTAEEVFADLDSVDEKLRPYLNPDNKILGTMLRAGTNLGAAFFQTNSKLSAYGVFKDSAIRHIQALAAGVGSGFRLSQKEIDTAVANFPKITDNLPTMVEYISNLRVLLQNKERAFFQTDYRLNAPKADRAIPQPVGAGAPSDATRSGDSLGIRGS